jgi:hypothetical protein
MEYSMKENRIPNKILEVKVEEKHPKARPKLRWQQDLSQKEHRRNVKRRCGQTERDG